MWTYHDTRYKTQLWKLPRHILKPFLGTWNKLQLWKIIKVKDIKYNLKIFLRYDGYTFYIFEGILVHFLYLGTRYLDTNQKIVLAFRIFTEKMNKSFKTQKKQVSIHGILTTILKKII